MLVVMGCTNESNSTQAVTRHQQRCVVINPHIEYDRHAFGGRDTLYGTNSALEGARHGDRLTFIPMVQPDQVPPKSPARLRTVATAMLKSARRVSDPAIIKAAVRWAKRTNEDNPNNTLPFVRSTNDADVWELSLTLLSIGVSPSNISAIIPPTTLVSVDNLTSSGAVLRSNRFNFSTCSARFKSSNSLVINNTFSESYPNIALTDLPRWFEGRPFISNVSFIDNIFAYGEGVNPVHPNAADTTNIEQRGNKYLSALPSQKI